MADWENKNVPEGGGNPPEETHPDGPPDLSFEMPSNIAALSQDDSWAEQSKEEPHPAAESAASLTAGGLPPVEDAAEAPAVQEASPPGKKPGGKERFLRLLGNVVPKKGDPTLEIVRKCVFFVALLTLIGSAAYIVNDMVIVPYQNELQYTDLNSQYNPDDPEPVPSGYEDYEFPEGMADAFKSLYLKNTELRGWLKYTDNANGWLNINYPVMYSGDNHKYLELDFYQTTNKNGALFFDERNQVNSADDTNRALIIYGHNMASGQMFAGLNQFLNNIEKAKSAPVIQLDTLYERSQYKVFAVMLINNREEDGPRFDYIRTDFADDADFMEQVANMRARSLYDYPVDVKEDDGLLILSTCTAKSGAKFDDGRLAVVARRVREGETDDVNTSAIVRNEDVIMPLAWYTNQDKEPHAFYTDPDYVIENNWTPPTEPGETESTETTATTMTEPPTTTTTSQPPATTTTTGRPTTPPPTEPPTTTTTSQPPATTTTTGRPTTPPPTEPPTTTTTSQPPATTTTTERPTTSPPTEPTPPPTEPEGGQQEGE